MVSKDPYLKAVTRKKVEKLATRLLGEDEVRRLKTLPIADVGFGYDSFGMERETVMATYLLMRYVYKHYFRVESVGHDNIPTHGRALIVSNHSGTIPLDGAMIGIDMLYSPPTPRIIRAAVDNFVAALPFLGLTFNRLGQVSGTRLNMHRLLEREELVAIFPEGTRGIGKSYRDRYKLRDFTVGFVELALRTGAPIIPTAVVGAEEQAPILAKSRRLGKLVGVPWIPITPTFPFLGPLGFIPYPSKYQIIYGEPIDFSLEYDESDVSDPKLVKKLASEIRQRVQDLVDEGLKKPHGLNFLPKALINDNGKKLLEKFIG